MISPGFFTQASWRDYVFAFVALLLARPIALLVALLGARLGLREKLVAAWFGPKGFASVVYAIMVLRSNVPDAEHMFHLIALVIVRFDRGTFLQRRPHCPLASEKTQARSCQSARGYENLKSVAGKTVRPAFR